MSFESGKITLEVEWAFTKWTVKTGTVLEGAGFIIDILPSNGGVEDKGATNTKIVVTYKSNSSNIRNSQELVLRSPDNSLTQTIVINQTAKPVIHTNITVNPETTYQTISGFGGAAIWHALPLSDSHIQNLLGTGENDLGLSIVRVRIAPNENDWTNEVSMLQKMETYGVKILASPWSPPGKWKENTQTNPLINGHLKEDNYADYAAYLNRYVEEMATENIVIDAISIQNEPDWKADYESCEWTPAQLFNFVRDHAHAIKNTKVVASESLSFNVAYTDPILNDPVAVENIHIVGGHLYANRIPTPYTLAEQKGKEIWMTEYLLNRPTGQGALTPEVWATLSEKVIWDETIEMLDGIHLSMASNWHAYIYWYMRRYYAFLGDGTGGTVNGEILKRGYAFSHFSKFVRPGYERINLGMENNAAGLKITAYKGDNKIVAVILNTSNSPVYGVNFLNAQNITSAEMYTTSEFVNREAEPLTPEDNKVTLDLASRSVTTVVMQF